MIKSVHLHRMLAAALLCAQAVSVTTGNAQIVDLFFSTATSAPGVHYACPAGDGDLLSANGLTITVTLIDNTQVPMPNVPATDMWIADCSPGGLVLCSATESPFVGGVTDAAGIIMLDGSLAASGCDNSGLYVVVQGFLIPTCVPITVRTPDMKSGGAPGPPACGGEILCPDGKVTLADLAYFLTHYPTAANPTPPYVPCVDFWTPYGAPVTLVDFVKMASHYSNSPAHQCL